MLTGTRGRTAGMVSIAGVGGALVLSVQCHVAAQGGILGHCNMTLCALQCHDIVVGGCSTGAAGGGPCIGVFRSYSRSSSTNPLLGLTLPLASLTRSYASAKPSYRLSGQNSRK